MITILDFYAEWCGPCKKVTPLLDELATENADLEIQKIDVDLKESESLVKEHLIRSIPTLLFMKEDTIVHKHVGAITKTQLEELLTTFK